MKKLLLSMLKASITQILKDILTTAVMREKITPAQKESIENIAIELEHIIKP